MLSFRACVTCYWGLQLLANGINYRCCLCVALKQESASECITFGQLSSGVEVKVSAVVCQEHCSKLPFMLGCSLQHLPYVYLTVAR